MLSFREELLTTCLERRDPETDKPFASGESANNKLEADRIVQGSAFFMRTVGLMKEQVIEEVPDLEEVDYICPIPNGGTRFGEALSDALAPAYRIPVMYFRKEAAVRGIKRFSPLRANDRRSLVAARRILVVDDFCTKRTSLDGMLAMDEMADKDIDFFSIAHRGDPALLESDASRLRLHTLEVLSIPNMLPNDSPLWRYVNA